QVAGFEHGAQLFGRRGQRVVQFAAASSCRYEEGNTAALGQSAKGEDGGGQHQAHGTPGTHALVEQHHEVFAGVDVRILAAEEEQLALSEAAEEFEVLVGELAGQQLLEVAAGGDVGVAAQR